jgi:EF-P beta-lysylation protein EpmB
MQSGSPHDPLLRQVLPLAEELDSPDGFTTDPVGDQESRVTTGLLQKYAGRVLLITTGACPAHCRFCFRRHYPYAKGSGSVRAWRSALDRIAADRCIEEVILSGGDPLMIGDLQLGDLVAQLAGIPHLRRLRLHTRLPVMIPERINEGLIGRLTETRLAPILVIHSNHPAELDEAVSGALTRLVDAGIPVLNQSVLLRGVNDCAETLAELSRRLVDLRVLPYYLHQLDRVAGASHFEVPVSEGARIVERLRATLPGYAVPRYVQERPGDPGKRPLA